MNRGRGILIAGNWKMNHGPRETEAFFGEIQSRAGSDLGEAALTALKSNVLRACVIPPSLSLEDAHRLAGLAPFPVTVAAQNVHWEKKGAYTGEISGPMLAEIGVNWALVGHSERRQYFGETNETVRKRTESLLAQGFHLIVCVGETRAEREAGKTRDVLLAQMTGCLEKIPLDGRVILAYEPVWAIGTGLTATPAQAEEVHNLLRTHIKEKYGESSAVKTQILYGGSITPENLDSLLSCPNVDGGLVGGSSLKPESFLALLRIAGTKIQ